MDLLFRRKGTEISGFRMITCRRVVTLCIKSTLSLDIIQNRYPNEKCEMNGREKRERERE